MSRVLKFKCRGHVDWRHKVQCICVPGMNAMNDLGFLGFFFHNAHLRLKRLYDAIRHQHLEGHVVIDQMGYGISFVPILGDNFIRIYHHDRNWHSIFLKFPYFTIPYFLSVEH